MKERIYIYHQEDWPRFIWNIEELLDLLSEVGNKQGRLIGKMETLGFSLQNEAFLETLTTDIQKSTEIEGITLNREDVRSSVARKLGLDIGGLPPTNRDIEGVVDMMFDATSGYSKPLTKERLFNWHLWFVTLHPFDDGNGRIARAVTDMLLARSDGIPQRFYSMSSQIRKGRKRF